MLNIDLTSIYSYEDCFEIVTNPTVFNVENKIDGITVEEAWKVVSTPVKKDLKHFVKKYYDKACSKNPECKDMKEIIYRRLLDAIAAETWFELKEEIK